MIIIYFIMIPIVLLDLETVSGMNPRNDANEVYVPKRRRRYTYEIKQWLKNRVNKTYK